MAERERVEKAVFEAIDKMNSQLPKGVAIEKSDDGALYGKSGKLESLERVAFIMELESAIQNEFDGEFMLTDANLLSQQSSQFPTLGSFVEHILEDRARNA